MRLPRKLSSARHNFCIGLVSDGIPIYFFLGFEVLAVEIEVEPICSICSSAAKTTGGLTAPLGKLPFLNPKPSTLVRIKIKHHRR